MILLLGGILVHHANGALIGHWTFDNGVNSADTVLVDSAGTNEQGTRAGSESLPAFVTGLNGSVSALEFQADNDHVELLGSGAQNHMVQVAGATIAGWVKIPAAGLTSGTKSVIFYARNGSSTQARAALEINSGRLQGVGRGIDGGGVQLHGMATTLTADTEYFVATTLNYASNTISVYSWEGTTWLSSTGGVAFAAAGGVTPNTVSSFVRFGERTDGNQDFIGILDDVRIYNEVLSELDLKRLVQIPEPTSVVLLASVLLFLGPHVRRDR